MRDNGGNLALIPYHIWQTMSISWQATVLTQRQWLVFALVALGLLLVIGWCVSKIAHMLGEQRQRARAMALHQQLQGTYDERERIEQEQRTAAVTDAITGLPNQEAVLDALQERIAALARVGGTCAVIFMDIDHFKAVNDTWGHRAGDAVLHAVAQRLRLRARAGDLVGCYGGEEFAIILRNVVDSLEAYQIAEGLRRIVAVAPYRWDADAGSELVMIPVTASFGVALAPQHGRTRETLVQAAGEAVAVAKHGGCNRVWLAEWLQDAPELLPPQPDPLAHAA